MLISLQLCLTYSDVTRNFTFGGLKPMASAEREAITGIWGQSPQRGPGESPWSGGQGGEAPLKLRAFSWMYVQV